MARMKSVWVVPGNSTFDNLAHATWTKTGNLNVGAAKSNADVTAPNGNRKFRKYSSAVAFGRKQALRMGEETELGLHGLIENAKFYYVSNGKLISYDAAEKKMKRPEPKKRGVFNTDW